MERTSVTSHNSPPRFSWKSVLVSFNLLELFVTLRLFKKVRKQKVRKHVFQRNKLLLILNSHYALCPLSGQLASQKKTELLLNKQIQNRVSQTMERSSYPKRSSYIYYCIFCLYGGKAPIHLYPYKREASHCFDQSPSVFAYIKDNK